MLKGTCLKCGLLQYGWALRNPQHQICPNCGARLKITDGKGNIFREYNPLIAKKYYNKPERKDIHSE